MTSSGHILVINPGSTSTKLGVFQFRTEPSSVSLVEEATLDHTTENFSPGPVLNQLALRLNAVQTFLKSTSISPQIIMARGAPLHPLEGGIYEVNDEMLGDIRSAKYANHASNLAVLIGVEIAQVHKIPVYIAEPITTDEFEAIARISGVPGIIRKSRSHALNIKAVTRTICSREKLNFTNSRWVVSHMGGGISVAALKNGRIIDVNDALLGMGPFSPERAGALPLSALLSLAYTHDKQSLETKLSRESGLKGYLGTADLQAVEQRIDNGDDKARLIYEAMAYQISKEIAAMATVLNFDLNGIILTGGMAQSVRLCNTIIQRVNAISNIHIVAGEFELEALAEAGLRIMTGLETAKDYSSHDSLIEGDSQS